MRISDWSSDVCSSDLRGAKPMPALSAAGDSSPPDPTSGVGAGSAGLATGESSLWSRNRLSCAPPRERKSVGEGTRGSVRVNRGGRRILNKKKYDKYTE